MKLERACLAVHLRLHNLTSSEYEAQHDSPEVLNQNVPVSTCSAVSTSLSEVEHTTTTTSSTNSMSVVAPTYV